MINLVFKLRLQTKLWPYYTYMWLLNMSFQNHGNYYVTKSAQQVGIWLQEFAAVDVHINPGPFLYGLTLCTGHNYSNMKGPFPNCCHKVRMTSII